MKVRADMSVPAYNVEASKAEVARALGVSRERVGQIENEALAKIRLLVFATDEFPAIREAYGEERLMADVARDLARADRDHRRAIYYGRKRRGALT